MGHPRQSFGVSPTDGLPSATDAPLQRGELEKSAHFRTHAVQQPHRLFDYLVGAGEQHQRHVEAEALGRLEIDHHAANASSTITGMLIACSNPFSRRLSIQRLAAVHGMASQDHSACDHRACEPISLSSRSVIECSRAIAACSAFQLL